MYCARFLSMLLRERWNGAEDRQLCQRKYWCKRPGYGTRTALFFLPRSYFFLLQTGVANVLALRSCALSPSAIVVVTLRGDLCSRNYLWKSFFCSRPPASCPHRHCRHSFTSLRTASE